MKRVKMISADGGTEIEVMAEKAERFEQRGWRRAGEKPARRGRSTKADEAVIADEEK